MSQLTTDQQARAAAYAAAVTAGAADEAGIAQACGVDVEAVAADLADPAFATALDAALSAADSPEATAGGPAASLPVALFQPRAPVTDADAEPAALALRARRVTAGLLAIVDDAVNAGVMDADDAAKLLPRVHQVHADHARLEAARGDTRKLPTVHITFDMRGAVAAELVAPRGAEVIDVEPTDRAAVGALAGPEGGIDDLLRGINAGLAARDAKGTK